MRYVAHDRRGDLHASGSASRTDDSVRTRGKWIEDIRMSLRKRDHREDREEPSYYTREKTYPASNGSQAERRRCA